MTILRKFWNKIKKLHKKKKVLQSKNIKKINNKNYEIEKTLFIYLT